MVGENNVKRNPKEHHCRERYKGSTECTAHPTDFALKAATREGSQRCLIYVSSMWFEPRGKLLAWPPQGTKVSAQSGLSVARLLLLIVCAIYMPCRLLGLRLPDSFIGREYFSEILFFSIRPSKSADLFPKFILIILTLSLSNYFD